LVKGRGVPPRKRISEGYEHSEEKAKRTRESVSQTAEDKVLHVARHPPRVVLPKKNEGRDLLLKRYAPQVINKENDRQKPPRGGKGGLPEKRKEAVLMITPGNTRMPGGLAAGAKARKETTHAV